MGIGILALQGAFTEHEKMLAKLGADSYEIRQRADFTKEMSGLILPGGESTVMEKLMQELELKEPILQVIQSGIPVMGTCAGMILLAKTVIGGENHLACMDITVERNAYGRQLGSFKTVSRFDGTGIIPMVFIRAPYVTNVGKEVKVLAKVGGKIVAAREKNMLACAFHPELTEDVTVHSHFLHMCR